VERFGGASACLCGEVQDVDFSVPLMGAVVGDTFDMLPWSSAGAPVVMQVLEGPCSVVDAKTISFDSIGNCLLRVQSVGAVDEGGSCRVASMYRDKWINVAPRLRRRCVSVKRVCPCAATQTISLSSPPFSFAGGFYVPVVSSSVGYVVSLTVTSTGNRCSVSGSFPTYTVTFIKKGECSLSAFNTGFTGANDCPVTLAAATAITFTIQDTPASALPQTIVFTAPSVTAKGVGTSTAVSATVTSGLTVVITASGGVCTYNSNTQLVTVTAAGGTCTLTGNEAGVPNIYLAAPTTTTSFPTVKGTQIVSFTNPSEKKHC
jgi:hypothetical protein